MEAFDRQLVGRCVDFEYNNDVFGYEILLSISVPEEERYLFMEEISQRISVDTRHSIDRSNSKIDSIKIYLPNIGQNQNTIAVEIKKSDIPFDDESYKRERWDSSKFNQNLNMVELYRIGENGSIDDLTYVSDQKFSIGSYRAKVIFECEGTTPEAKGSCSFFVNHNSLTSITAVISERDMINWESVVDVIINEIDELIPERKTVLRSSVEAAALTDR